MDALLGLLHRRHHRPFSFHLLGAQANTMVTLQGEAKDATAFPSGRWPDATAGLFSDGTVTDGDADWSLA